MNSSFFLGVAASVGFFTLFTKFRFQQDNNDTNSSSSSLPSPPTSLCRICKHHVFPSFHGADVRKTFLSHILETFRRKGIDAFIDSDIERSKSIGPELIQAIRRSKIAIVLLSRKYASSSWCLDELVEIMKSREELSQIVMTIFYEVDPTDVKKQSGDFGKAFKKTCEGKTKEHTERWRKALEDVATIAGEHSRNWSDDAAMIEKIATDVSNKLNSSTPSRYYYGLVGMRAHMKRTEELLRLDLDEVRMIGIWGPPGIGKVTIARLRKALEDVATIAGEHSRNCVRSEEAAMIEKIATDVSNMSNMLNSYTPSKDFDDLVGMRAHMEMMERIGKTNIARVMYNQVSDRFQLGTFHPYEGFGELAWEVMALAGNLPLELKVLGSVVRGMSKQEWERILPRLKSDRNPKEAEIVQAEARDRYTEFSTGNYGAKPKSSSSDAKTNIDLLDRIFTNSRMDGKVKPPKIQVFINFRGEQLRNSFIGYLVDALRRSEINVYIDYQEHRGEDLNILFKRIEDSGIAIVVFSSRYTESEWCLDELVKIKERVHQGLLKVLPIFYKVTPTNVKRLKGDFGDHFREKEYKYESDEPMIKRWKEAIRVVSHKFALTYDEKSVSEIDFVETIVKKVLEMLQAISKVESGQSSCNLVCAEKAKLKQS